jgi:hypothetical protein
MTISSITFCNISDATNAIVASPAPILFPDTCALLDLIRLPQIPFQEKTVTTARKKRSGVTARREIEAVKRIISFSLRSPCDLWIVIPSLVQREWKNGISKEQEELRNYLKKLDKHIEIVHAVADTTVINLPGLFQYLGLNLEEVLEDLCVDFFSGAILLSEDNACRMKALKRLEDGRPPAKQGGGELDDCKIIEHCVELCAQLRSLGFSERCVFLTSNTHDYCNLSPIEPKGILKSELGAVSLSLTTDWRWTKSELGI